MQVVAGSYVLDFAGFETNLLKILFYSIPIMILLLRFFFTIFFFFFLARRCLRVARRPGRWRQGRRAW